MISLLVLFLQLYLLIVGTVGIARLWSVRRRRGLPHFFPLLLGFILLIGSVFACLYVFFWRMLPYWMKVGKDWMVLQDFPIRHWPLILTVSVVVQIAIVGGLLFGLTLTRMEIAARSFRQATFDLLRTVGRVHAWPCRRPWRWPKLAGSVILPLVLVLGLLAWWPMHRQPQNPGGYYQPVNRRMPHWWLDLCAWHHPHRATSDACLERLLWDYTGGSYRSYKWNINEFTSPLLVEAALREGEIQQKARNALAYAHPRDYINIYYLLASRPALAVRLAGSGQEEIRNLFINLACLDGYESAWLRDCLFEQMKFPFNQSCQEVYCILVSEYQYGLDDLRPYLRSALSSEDFRVQRAAVAILDFSLEIGEIEPEDKIDNHGMVLERIVRDDDICRDYVALAARYVDPPDDRGDTTERLRRCLRHLDCLRKKHDLPPLPGKDGE